MKSLLAYCCFVDPAGHPKSLHAGRFATSVKRRLFRMTFGLGPARRMAPGNSHPTAAHHFRDGPGPLLPIGSRESPIAHPLLAECQAYSQPTEQQRGYEDAFHPRAERLALLDLIRP